MVNNSDASLIQTSLSAAFLDKQKVIETAKSAVNELAQLAAMANSTDTNTGEQKQEEHKDNTMMYIIIGAIVLIIIVLAVVIFCCCCGKKEEKPAAASMMENAANKMDPEKQPMMEKNDMMGMMEGMGGDMNAPES